MIEVTSAWTGVKPKSQHLASPAAVRHLVTVLSNDPTAVIMNMLSNELTVSRQSGNASTVFKGKVPEMRALCHFTSVLAVIPTDMVTESPAMTTAAKKLLASSKIAKESMAFLNPLLEFGRKPLLLASAAVVLTADFGQPTHSALRRVLEAGVDRTFEVVGVCSNRRKPLHEGFAATT